MPYIILLTIVVWWWGRNPAQAQTGGLDSLIKEIEKGEADEAQIARLTLVSNYQLRRNLEETRFYAIQALELARSLESPVGQGTAMNLLGIYYMDTGQLDSARYFIQEAIRVLSDTDDIGEYAKALSTLGHLERSNNDFTSAFEYYLKAVRMIEEAEDPALDRVLCATLNNVAITLYAKEQYEAGLPYALRAVEIAERVNYVLGAGVLLSTVGRLYSALGEKEKAIAYFQRSLRIKQRIDDKTGTVSLLTSLANVFMLAESLDSAKVYLKSALALSEEINYASGQPPILFNLAEIAIQEKEIQAGLYYARRGLDMTRADQYAEYRSEFFRTLASAHANANRYDSAYLYQRSYVDLKDTLIQQQQVERISELQSKWELEKAQQENTFLKEAGKRDNLIIHQRNFLILASVITIFLLTALIIATTRRSRLRRSYNEQLSSEVQHRTRELSMANEELSQANLELSTLNYIASHDIKEPIRNIGNYAGMIKRKLPPEWRQELSFDFDVIIRSSKHLYTLVEDFSTYQALARKKNKDVQIVDLEETVEMIRGMLSIDEVSGKIVSGDLPTLSANASLLYILLKNLIENGLKYNTSDVPLVKVSYERGDDAHYIAVSDNGIGIDPDFQSTIFELFKRLHNREQYPGTGVGLAMVKLILKKLNGGIQIQSEPGQGSTFTVRLPIV